MGPSVVLRANPALPIPTIEPVVVALFLLGDLHDKLGLLPLVAPYNSLQNENHNEHACSCKEPPKSLADFPTCDELSRVVQNLGTVFNIAIVDKHGKGCEIEKDHDAVLYDFESRPVEQVIVLNPLFVEVSDQKFVNDILKKQDHASEQGE